MSTWGIWGVGTVGKSAIRHLYRQGASLCAYDRRSLTPQELIFLQDHQVTFYAHLDKFIASCDYIVPSPGVALPQEYRPKLVHELDLFTQHWHKPIIGVTGSVGKTTLVSLIDQLLKWHTIPCATGGNIGTAMLDLLEQKESASYALLELSSFQLEYARCAPQLAVLTNFHPNHLDRHGTEQAYFDAKYRLFEFQGPNDRALVPLSLRTLFRERTQRPLSFFSLTPPDEQQRAQLHEGDSIYIYNSGTLMVVTTTKKRTYHLAEATRQALSTLLPETALLLLAVADLLNIPLEDAALVPPRLTMQPHRRELVDTINGISYFNDSKSTILTATFAAVHSISSPTHLILGGLSKGVDRLRDLPHLKHQVASVTCFGAEAQELHAACKQAQIPSSSHGALDEAFQAALMKAKSGDALLLSPAGSSYDLYNNYEERGIHFRALVAALKKESSEELS